MKPEISRMVLDHNMELLDALSLRLDNPAFARSYLTSSLQEEDMNVCQKVIDSCTIFVTLGVL